MKSYKEFIAEAKQVGTLYHYTNPHALHAILSSNRLRSSEYNDDHISFTRDKSFNRLKRNGIDTASSLELDGNRMSNNYKISPYHDQEIDGNHAGNISSQGRNEMEERHKGTIENIMPFIKKIRLHKPDHSGYSEVHQRIKDLAKIHGIPVEHST